MTKPKKATLLGSFGSLFAAVFLIMVVRWILVEPYVIPSGSMIPSLLVHDHIFVNKFEYGVRWPFSKQWMSAPRLPERGEIVVFRSVETPGMFMIKRVVGLPGDKLVVNDEGQLLVNGQLTVKQSLSPASVDYSPEDLQGPRSQFNFFQNQLEDKEFVTILRKNSWERWEKEYEVPEGHIFLMGDNRDNSRDSRFWGTLPVENLLGKAMFVWLSCVETFESAPFLCNPLTVRFKRFLHVIK